MSIQVTTAFVQQYSANVQLTFQQNGSKLRTAVNEETVDGKIAYFDQVGATAARLRTTRHADTPRMDTPHTRRSVALSDYDWGDLIDQEDRVRLLMDPTSAYVRNAGMAMGRAVDQVVVDAIRGTAQTGETGGTAVTLPTAQKVAQGGAGLSTVKLIATQKILNLSDIPSDGRYIAVTSEQLEDLFNLTTVTSADYNTVRALVKGEVETFLGFNFIRLDGLRIDGTLILPIITATDRACVAWQRDQVNLGIGKNPTARISERSDKNYATQVFYSMSIGATRMQEKGVVEVACFE